MLTDANAQPPRYGSPTLTVSAAPRWVVDKRPSPIGARFIPGSGPNQEDGYVVGFAIGVKAVGSRKGLEPLQPDWSFDDDFSNGTSYPGSQLVTWNIVNDYATIRMAAGTEPTQQNACGDVRSQFSAGDAPFDWNYSLTNDLGATASTSGVTVARGGVCTVDSGSVNNTAKTASFNVTNTNFSLAHFPTRSGSGGAILVTSDLDAASNEWWVANKTVLVWIPLDGLTPGQAYEVDNKATLKGKTLTGQDYTSPQAEAKARLDHQVAGGFRKIYTTLDTWSANALTGANIDILPRDPNMTSDTFVNQAAPGQMLAARLHMRANAAGFDAGYACEKIDNARLSFADLRTIATASASYRKDAGTGILTRTLAGDPAFTLNWQLGVGGTGTTNNGWDSHSSVTGEYEITGVGNPLQSGANAGTQATAGCADGDATWFDSIAALEAAGHTLADVTRVRGSYDEFPASTQLLLYFPLQVRSNYRHDTTDLVRQNSNANPPITTVTHAVGDDTLESISPNQAFWQGETGVGDPLRSSDALRITRTEYVGITKTALAPYQPGGPVSRASAVTYRLVVNATSSTDAHPADIVVWDVLPQHVAYRPGSSSFGGTPIADPVCAAPGVTPSGPFASGSVAPGFQACRWTLANRTFVKAPIGDASGDQPPLQFTAVVSPTAPTNITLLNTSVADSPLNRRLDAIYNGATQGFQCAPRPGLGAGSGSSCSIGNYSLRISSDSGLVIDKAVSAGAVPANTGFEYVLSYTAVGNPLNDVRLLDVLPYASGDARGSAYAGTLRLAGPIAAPVAEPGAVADAAMAVRYTSNAPGDIHRDPYHAGHNLVGTGTNSALGTNWCTSAQFGEANCPVDAGAATAILARPLGSAQMPAGGSYRLHVPVLAAGNAQGNVYWNDFIADSSSLQARRPSSNLVQTRVVMPDLVLGKTAAPGELKHGETAVFTIRVANNTGEDMGAILANPAPTIVMTDPMPAGLLAQLPATGTDWNCGASTPAEVRCQYTGALPILPGAQVGGDITVTALATPAAATGVRLDNCAGVGLSGQAEASTGNNGGCAGVTVSAVEGLAVSGRVYEEKSGNTTDDGNATDPGIAGTSVRLVCTNPAFDQSTTTDAEGGYSFTGLQSGAQCTLTETQPSGYTNAYNTPGVGGTGQTGDSGTGDSTITLTMGTVDSTGNNFAEKRTAAAPTPVPVMGWPGLALLALLLGGLGLSRRRAG
ncbi:SdrD B-like domain-containing protein [Ottowia sp.]|uniref:SdrD B-like domain-containing protein n=1 Tax=Ottowia sp. TaxID=1898956 RepID=UPI0025FBE5F1|nr:SdrD B-like domain-containing protein [Ottowia sp.]MBK6745765.1 hypothetical protein [Ottowia sp.]